MALQSRRAPSGDRNLAEYRTTVPARPSSNVRSRISASQVPQSRSRTRKEIGPEYLLAGKAIVRRLPLTKSALKRAASILRASRLLLVGAEEEKGTGRPSSENLRE